MIRFADLLVVAMLLASAEAKASYLYCNASGQASEAGDLSSGRASDRL